jgi:DNA replication and repair protein RecF
MHVSRVEVRDFRSHAHADIALADGITVLTGPVGAGKTNLLEAVHVGCTGRSFRTANERELVRFGERAARVQLTLTLAGGEHTTEVAIAPGSPKTVRRDGVRVTHPQAGSPDLFVCVFAPDHLELVKGPAGGRRARLDDLVQTVWPARRAARASYARALAQRNALIGRVRAGSVAAGALHGWDRELSRHGMELMSNRRELVDALTAPFTRRAHVLGLPEPAALTYRPRSPARHPEELEQELRERLGSDLERGFTLHGPHRDDLQLTVAGRDLRRYGSQGQQRLGLLALLLAERDVLHEVRDAIPLMLLDDVLSELDAERRRLLLETLASGGQTLVSTADERAVPASVRFERIALGADASRPPGDLLARGEAG